MAAPLVLRQCHLIMYITISEEVEKCATLQKNSPVSLLLGLFLLRHPGCIWTGNRILSAYQRCIANSSRVTSTSISTVILKK